MLLIMSRKYFNTKLCQRFYSVARNSGFEDTVFDKIIVGAGSAGCVLANRITEDADQVLLLEAGPRDSILGIPWLEWRIHMPAALTYNLCNDRYNWYYHTIPQPHVDERRMYWPRGRVWGGSSSLNAMVYVRGHAEDYNRWEREGAAGWSYEKVLPYFKKAQTHSLGGDQYKGHEGPLHVTRYEGKKLLDQAWLKAGQQAGYPFSEDMNGYQQEGVGYMDSTVHNGMRWSAASAYLRPALRRKNLTTLTNVLVTRIILEGNKAVGVELVDRGKTKKFRAEEIILSGGAINTPQLLMLSGIGDQTHLREVGIETLHHLPGVGQNLQDHLDVYIVQGCTKPVSLYSEQRGARMIQVGLEWFLARTGAAATTHLETGGFIRSDPGVPHPNIQFHFFPSQVVDHGRKPPELEAYQKTLQVHVDQLRPSSVGWIKLDSADPRKHPLINPNYLSTEQDRHELRQCVRLTREILSQAGFDEFRGPEISPGPEVQTDKQIDAFVRKNCDTDYHPSCTCKMGDPTDNMAVVDSHCKVLGLERLRIVDASIMPSIVSGNLNAPTIMMAEKAADMIRGREPLAPETGVQVYQADTR